MATQASLQREECEADVRRMKWLMGWGNPKDWNGIERVRAASGRLVSVMPYVDQIQPTLTKEEEADGEHFIRGLRQAIDDASVDAALSIDFPLPKPQEDTTVPGKVGE